MLSIPGIFQGRLMVSISEAASLLGLRPKTLYNQISVGCCPIPTLKLGGRRLIRIEDLCALTGSDYPLRSPTQLGINDEPSPI
jgi:hypothetical protein